METVPFTIASERTEYLGLNLINKKENVHTEHHQMFQKESK